MTNCEPRDPGSTHPSYSSREGWSSIGWSPASTADWPRTNPPPAYPLAKRPMASNPPTPIRPPPPNPGRLLTDDKGTVARRISPRNQLNAITRRRRILEPALLAKSTNHASRRVQKTTSFTGRRRRMTQATARMRMCCTVLQGEKKPLDFHRLIPYSQLFQLHLHGTSGEVVLNPGELACHLRKHVAAVRRTHRLH